MKEKIIKYSLIITIIFVTITSLLSTLFIFKYSKIDSNIDKKIRIKENNIKIKSNELIKINSNNKEKEKHLNNINNYLDELRKKTNEK